MRYLFGGSGPPLLLVHGLMGFSFSWSENLSAFAENCTVYAPDLFNVGYSDRYELDPDLKTTASQLLQFMDTVGIETTDLLGTSYGGTLAMALAASIPRRINRLILVAPAHCGSEGNRWQSRFFSSRPGGIAAQLIHLAPAFVHAYFIKRMYSKPLRALPGTVEEYSAALRARGTIAPLVKLMHCWTRNFAVLASMMPSIAIIPTLFVWGSNDYVVPIQTMDSLAANFRTAHISIIDDAGHLPYEEQPEEFNEIVLSFLKRRKSCGRNVLSVQSRYPGS